MIYDKVWVLNPDARDDQTVWLSGEIETKETLVDESFRLTIKAAKGRHFETITMDSDAQGELSGVQRRNDDGQVIEDLIRLTHLHEPAILHALVERFYSELIYTYTGPILIAVNPFQPLDLYTDAILESYYEGGVARSQGFETAALPPHVYAVAADTYQDMSLRLARARSVRLPQGPVRADSAVSQSILISGESGSGKTVSTKHCLEYLTTVGQAAGDRSKGLKLASMQRDIDSNKIVQSNPILEAFGNARTLRNDNSSRFGKLVQIYFDGFGEILGGGISSYLLEKVRLIKQSPGERNFHIFYQLCASANTSSRNRTLHQPTDSNISRDSKSIGSASGSTDSSQRCYDSEVDRWGLKHAKAYLFSNQGGIFVIRDVSDVKALEEVRHAMTTLDFSEREASNVFDIAASVLHVGEVSFAEDLGYGSVVEDEWSQSSARRFCELTGVDFTALIAALTTKDVSTKSETVIKPLRPIDAVEARDALAKALYSRLFDWLVAKINRSLGTDDPRAIQASANVLDIFGFECFEENSLEQLCINYTNEKLQQHFNNYVFKLEEEEYTREGIEWSFIDFPDNQDILNLIEGKKPLGILTLLDDECNNPSGSDKNFTFRIYKSFLGEEMDELAANTKMMRRASTGGIERAMSPSFGFLGDKSDENSKHPRFDATRLMKPRGKFSIVHYAGSVTYSAEGFWAKNRDEFPVAARELLQRSTNPFVKHLFKGDDGGNETVFDFETLDFDVDSSNKLSSGMRQVTLSRDRVDENDMLSPRNGKQPLKTVAKKFQAQLADLMARLSATQPHYIRCLKPNDGAEPFVFNQRRVAEQLRYGGVLEAVRVSRSGFPVRMPHWDFYYRYRRLVLGHTLAGTNEKENTTNFPLSIKGGTAPEVVESLTRTLTKKLLEVPTIFENEKYKSESVQFGKTKIFLRKEAHDALEARVLNSRLRAATQVQATSRRILAMKNYFLKVSAIRLLQRCLRGYHGRLLAAHARKCLESAITLQSFARGNRARSMVKLIRRDRAVLRIQKVFRGKPSLWLFIRLRKAMISVQCAVRVKKSAILRKHLAVEAKSLQTLQRKNEELAAQLVKQKERDDELQRQEAIYTMEKARADAETARQKQADRVLRRVLIRFKHSVPLAGAMQVWTRATRMAAAIAEENKRQSMRLEAELKQIEESHNNSKKQEQAILILGAWAQSSKIKRLQQYWMRVRLFVASEKAMEERDQAKRATEKESSRAGKLADQIETLQHELHALETEGATVESELKFAALELEKKVKILEDSAVLSESVHNEERSAAEFKQNGLLDELELTKARADALEKALQEEQNAKESEGAAHEREVEEHRAVVEKLKDTESELASQAEKCALLESQALETKALREIGDADAMNTERELRSKIAELEEALRKEHESRLADHAKAGEEVESVKAKLIESENLLSAERAERDSDNRKLVANVLESNHKTLKRIEDFGQSLHQAEDENALTQAFSEADAKFDALKRALLDSEDKVSCKNVEHDLGYEALGEKMEEMSNEVSTRVRGLVDSLRTESACRADIEQLRMVETTRAVEALNSVNAAFKKADEALTSEEAGNAFGSITIIEKIEKLSLEASDRMNDLENLLATEKTTRAELEELRTADHALSESTIDSLKETLQSLEGKKLSLSITEERLNADIESLKHENAQLDGELLKMKDQLASSEIALSHEAARAKAAGSEAESLIQELKAKLVTVEDAIISETEARATAEEGTMRISTECESLKSSLAGVELELQEERTNRSADNETHQAEIEKSEIALQEMVSQVKVLEEKVSKDQAEQETEATRVSHALQEWESKCTSLEDTLNQERLDRASERGDDQELIDYLRNEVAEVKLDLSKEQEDLKVMRREAKERAQSIQALSDEAEKRIQELNDSLKEEETKKAELALDLQRKIEFEESLSAKLDELEQSLVHEKELRLAADEMSDATARSMREAVEGLESRLAQDEEDKARWAEEVEQSSFAAAKRIQELEDVLEEGEYRRVEFELEAQHKEEDLAELRHHLADVEAKLSAALAAVAAIEDPAITAAKISALEDEVAAEKAARQADQSEAQAKEEQLEQTLRSVRDEALLKGNQLPELIARVESLDEALAKERAGRAEDVKVHQATHAAVEARSKQATDELRSQVGALMEAMSKERTVRAKQRSELDTKAAAAAATVDALKAKVINLEQALETEAEKFKAAQAGASTIRQRLEEQLETLASHHGDLSPVRALYPSSEMAASKALELQLARAKSMSPPSSPSRFATSHQRTAAPTATTPEGPPPTSTASATTPMTPMSPDGPPPSTSGYLDPETLSQLSEPSRSRSTSSCTSPPLSPARQLVERLRESASS